MSDNNMRRLGITQHRGVIDPKWQIETGDEPQLGGKGEDNSPMLPRLVAIANQKCEHEWYAPTIRDVPIPGIYFCSRCGALNAAGGAIVIDDDAVTID